MPELSVADLRRIVDDATGVVEIFGPTTAAPASTRDNAMLSLRCETLGLSLGCLSWIDKIGRAHV